MEFITQNLILLIFLFSLWVIPWKAYALWTAARTSNKKWFIIILLFNTFAILEIIYIFYIAKKTKEDIRHVLQTPIFPKK